MYTVQQVFDKAIWLMDAQNESTGSTKTSDTKEYELRTPGLVNTMLNDVYPVSDTCAGREDGKRPFLPEISAMEDTLDLDAYCCMSILPFGLAGLLLTEEDPTRADFFWQTYQERLQKARASMPASVEPIEDVYGANCQLEYGQFSRWT